MTVFVSGGAKNGKSDFAQELALKLAGDGPRYYVATMIPCDGEDNNRIERHRESRRGMGFETLEQGRNLCACLEKADPAGTFLVDSATALLMNELFPEPASTETDPTAPERCGEELTVFLGRVKNAVVVSDAIYADAARYDAVTENYRKGLACIDRTLARVCDTVIEVAAGIPIVHKGGLPE